MFRFISKPSYLGLKVAEREREGEGGLLEHLSLSSPRQIRALPTFPSIFGTALLAKNKDKTLPNHFSVRGGLSC